MSIAWQWHSMGSKLLAVFFSFIKRLLCRNFDGFILLFFLEPGMGWIELPTCKAAKMALLHMAPSGMRDCIAQWSTSMAHWNILSYLIFLCFIFCLYGNSSFTISFPVSISFLLLSPTNFAQMLSERLWKERLHNQMNSLIYMAENYHYRNQFILVFVLR